ncbi:hypothetical protein ABEB36_011198 [Hypothenemus hampei]|uniref:Protein-serine O-palmitoleoyltransferase porcupine n=1 Tax=Hypothenemus hampei TaxID=57062 RepID=A0ABD1EEI6_HYPHA
MEIENLHDLYQFEKAMDLYKNSFEEEYFQETFNDVWYNCALESIKSIYISIHKAVLVNLAFGLITIIDISENKFHWLSSLCGLYILFTTIQSMIGLMIVIISLSVCYFIIAALKKLRTPIERKNSAPFGAAFIQYFLISIFVLFEYMILDRTVWLEIRGIMMVFAMKLISIVSDAEYPGFLQYNGYMFCCANILNGPWISYNHYLMQAKYPPEKNIRWIYAVLRAGILSFFFLTVSNCWASYFIPESTSNQLFIGYKEALAVRTSHYFICYLSEIFMLAVGFKDFENHFNSESWRFSVTNFEQIEFPSSLAQVIINWNKPMHQFLKKYVYRSWMPRGRFCAVSMTFLISSLFHGLEIKVSAVLLTLGLFSYLQIQVREFMAQTFDICIRAYPCRECKHKIKRDNVICKMALVVLGAFTVLHLIFLGILMDPSTDEIEERVAKILISLICLYGNDGLPLKNVEKEFYEQTGAMIPWKKFKAESLRSWLITLPFIYIIKNMQQEEVLIEQSPKAMHVKELILKQKRQILQKKTIKRKATFQDEDINAQYEIHPYKKKLFLQQEWPAHSCVHTWINNNSDSSSGSDKRYEKFEQLESMLPLFYKHQALGDDFFVDIADTKLGYYVPDKGPKQVGLCSVGMTIAELTEKVKKAENLAPRVVVMIGFQDLIANHSISSMITDLRQLVIELEKMCTRITLITLIPSPKLPISQRYRTRMDIFNRAIMDYATDPILNCNVIDMSTIFLKETEKFKRDFDRFTKVAKNDPYKVFSDYGRKIFLNALKSCLKEQIEYGL